MESTNDDAFEIIYHLDVPVREDIYDYPTFHLTMHCYLCSIVNGELTLLEHEDAKWLSKDEIDSVGWLPADVELIETLKKILK